MAGVAGRIGDSASRRSARIETRINVSFTFIATFFSGTALLGFANKVAILRNGTFLRDQDW
jgi:hypothetical protein